MVARQLAAYHAAAIIDDRERGALGIGCQHNAARTRIERIGHDLGEDDLLERAGIRVPQILEQMLQIDPGFSREVLLAGIGRESSARQGEMSKCSDSVVA